MRIAQTGLEVSDKTVKRIIGFIAEQGIDLHEGYRNLSAKETAQGIANYLRPSSDQFIKEEEFIADIAEKLNKSLDAIGETQKYPKPLQNILAVIRQKQFTKILNTPDYKECCEKHNAILDNYFVDSLSQPKKKYPTTVQTISVKFLNNDNLSLDECGRKYDKYYNYYIEKIFNLVKEQLS